MNTGLSKRMMYNGSMNSQTSLTTTLMRTTDHKQGSPDGSKRFLQRSNVNGRLSKEMIRSGKLTVFSGIDSEDVQDQANLRESVHRSISQPPGKHKVAHRSIAIQGQEPILTNLKTDIDQLSDSNPLLADLINTRLSAFTDLENLTQHQHLVKLRVAEDLLT